MRTGSGRGAAQQRAAEAVGHEMPEGRGAGAPVGGAWLTRGKDGRLTAFARCREGLLRWTERRPGGPEWQGPDLFPAPNLTHVSIAQGIDGYLHFVGRRETRKQDGSASVAVVHAVQYQSGRPMTEWRSLGNPHADPAKAAALGIPVAGVSSSGRVYVFVRNAGRGLMMRREAPSGKWEAWADLKGSMLQDGFAVVTYSSGCLEVLGANQQGAMRWLQTERDGKFHQQPNIPVAVGPGTASGLETAPGRATYYWADPTAGGYVAHRPGGWVLPLGGIPGPDPLALLRAAVDGFDCTVLAHRGADGQAVFAVCGTENEQAGVWWSQAGEHCVGSPALVLDAYGRVVLGTIAADGTLRIARQQNLPGLSLGPAMPV